MQNNPIGVIGAGSWGTALAGLLSGKGHRVYLWGHREEHIKSLQKNRENIAHLPGLHFPKSLQVTSDLTQLASNCRIFCMVIPSQKMRTVFRTILPDLPHESIVISASKGIENESLATMTEVMAEELKTAKKDKKVELAVLTGPSFAREVADSVPTAVTIGCKNQEIAANLQILFGTDYFRVYTSNDLIGLETSGALKNVMALATGICDGLGYGLNTRAALITRGLAEITRFGIARGADPLTFSGLSGLGDLLLTCTGELSRNRSVGLQLGQGKSLDTILKEMKMVAEGVKTTLSGYNLAREYQVEMPILEQVYAVLYQGKDCGLAVRELLARELKPEQ